jgi:type I restriction enzyme S subunit
MDVLLSIRPRYVEAILAGVKKYEFRKYWPRQRKSNQKVYIYATAPVRKIVGTFTVKSVVEDSPQKLWKRFGSSGGIDSQAFFNYFESRDWGFAIELDNLDVFGSPIEPREQILAFVPPQSYTYVSRTFEKNSLSLAHVRRSSGSKPFCKVNRHASPNLPREVCIPKQPEKI